MQTAIAALKQTFRQGQRAQAIAECEALCLQQPANLDLQRLCATMQLMSGNYARALELLLAIRPRDPANGDVLFNIGMCQRELQDFSGAAQHFKLYTESFPGHPDGWASLAECRLQLQEFAQGIAMADRAIALDPASVPAWTVRAKCQRAAGQAEASLASYTEALRLAPRLAELLVQRGDIFESLGQLQQAADDYRAALALAPADDATLKKATTCLLQLDKGQEAIQACRDILAVRPDSLTAKLGVEWLLSQLVPLWHVPMMNEEARSLPYQQALQAAVTPGKTVLEIGTGSGLLAMMAARAGAGRVVTCEAVPLVAETAVKIIERNGLSDRIRVLAKPSYAVRIGDDLPEQADILVHEIFSSELLGEHVLPALEDAKARLLKPGGEVLPGAGSIMIALVGGDALGKELHVGQAFGFDLSPFNAIHPKKRPIQREDLERVLLSADVEAFRFDFRNAASFPAESRRLEIGVTRSGLCFGVIQWIRFEFGDALAFENHPARQRPVANWQHTVYRFEQPLQLEQGAVVAIDAMHDRSRPWFELAPEPA